MGKHHTEDYKLSAVKYALRTDNQVETCEVFDCKRSSLQEWIDLYQKTGSPVRKTRKNRIAYKVHQKHIDFLRAELKKKPDIFMSDLKELLEKKYPDVSLTRVHIGRLLRDNNKTRKRLRKIHNLLHTGANQESIKKRSAHSFRKQENTLWIKSSV